MSSFEAAVNAAAEGDIDALKSLLDSQPELIYARSAREWRDVTALHSGERSGGGATENPR